MSTRKYAAALHPAPFLPAPRIRSQLDIALEDIAEVCAAIDDALKSVRALPEGSIRTLLVGRLETQRAHACASLDAGKQVTA